MATPETASTGRMEPTAERAAVIATNSWAGRTEWACVVIGETRTRYRVRLLQETRLPRRTYPKDAIALVPKAAIRFV